MKKGKKIFLIVITLMVLVIGILIIVLCKEKNYMVNIEKVEKNLLKYYENIDLQTLDDSFLGTYFNIPIENSDDAIIMSNYSPYASEIDIGNPFLVLILNNFSKADINEWYYNLSVYIDQLKDLKPDQKKLYEKTILVKGNNYLYLIINKDAKTVQKEIENFK